MFLPCRGVADDCDALRQPVRRVAWLRRDRGCGVSTSLRSVVDSGVDLAPASVCDWAGHVVATLAAVHAQGSAHGAVSPSTIVLDDARKRARLRSVPGGSAPETYVLAPELRDGGSATAAADLYALGVVLYEACCGLPPDQVARRAGTGSRLTRPEGIPEALWGLVERLLDEEPQLRPASADEVAMQLYVLARTLADDPPAPRLEPAFRHPALAAAPAAGANDPAQGAQGGNEPAYALASEAGGGGRAGEAAERLYVLSADVPEASAFPARRGLIAAAAVALGLGAFGVTWLSMNAGSGEQDSPASVAVVTPGGGAASQATVIPPAGVSAGELAHVRSRTGAAR